MFRKTAIAATTSLLAALAAATAASAVESGWAETEGARMRLVVDPEPDARGVTRGALEIDLADGWKTYWIDPGASGIPPQIDLSGSQGIALEALRLPPPVRVDDGYSVWAGYKHPVSLALEMRRDGAAELKANVFLGICEKICVPFQAEFDLPLPSPAEVSGTDVRAKVAVNAAFDALPAPPRADFDVVSAQLSDDGETVTVQLRLPEAAENPELFVHGPDGWLFGTPEALDGETDEPRFSLPVESRPKSPSARVPLDVVVTLGDRAIETKVPLTRE